MSYRRSVSADLTEAERRIANTVVVGRIEVADYKANRVRVKSGDILTDWIPMATLRAGRNRTWDPFDVGEQVVMVAPSGDLSQAVVMGAVHSDARDAPADDPDITRTVYDNGTVTEHDRKTGRTSLTAPAGASVVTTVGGAVVTMDNDKVRTTIGGAVLSVTADSITLSVGGVSMVMSAGGVQFTGGTIKHNGKSIDDSHIHGAVMPGPATTSEPAN